MLFYKKKENASFNVLFIIKIKIFHIISVVLRRGSICLVDFAVPALEVVGLKNFHSKSIINTKLIRFFFLKKIMGLKTLFSGSRDETLNALGIKKQAHDKHMRYLSDHVLYLLLLFLLVFNSFNIIAVFARCIYF